MNLGVEPNSSRLQVYYLFKNFCLSNLMIHESRYYRKLPIVLPPTKQRDFGNKLKESTFYESREIQSRGICFENFVSESGRSIDVDGSIFGIIEYDGVAVESL